MPRKSLEVYTPSFQQFISTIKEGLGERGLLFLFYTNLYYLIFFFFFLQQAAISLGIKSKTERGANSMCLVKVLFLAPTSWGRE